MDASERTLSLPLAPHVTEAEQDDVLTALARIVRFYRA
jgi:dTDP-4-amino-4,6-dideoxygalactose transaminase